MYCIRTPPQIVQRWQDDIEQCMEAGSAPILELGAGQMPVEDLAALMALQRWSASRTDVTAPALPVGGIGSQWIAVLLGPLPLFDQSSPPQPIVLYAGTNLAEYLMSAEQLYGSAGATAATETSAIENAVSTRPAGLPVSYFAPLSQPGMSFSWDALPFSQLSAPPPSSLTPDQEDAPEDAPGEHLTDDPLRDWIAWSGLLLALFLVLLAILL